MYISNISLRIYRHSLFCLTLALVPTIDQQCIGALCSPARPADRESSGNWLPDNRPQTTPTSTGAYGMRCPFSPFSSFVVAVVSGDGDRGRQPSVPLHTQAAAITLGLAPPDVGFISPPFQTPTPVVSRFFLPAPPAPPNPKDPLNPEGRPTR